MRGYWLFSEIRKRRNFLLSRLLATVDAHQSITSEPVIAVVKKNKKL
jgi:hypothetical protein